MYSPFAARVTAMDIRNGLEVQPGRELLSLDAPNQAGERDKAHALADAYARAARGSLGLSEGPAAQRAVAEQQASRWAAEGRAREAELLRLRLVASHKGEVRDLDPLVGQDTWLGPSQLIAMVVDGRRWRVEALVPEHDRQRLSLESEAVVIVKGRTRKLHGQVRAIDSSPVKRLPHMLLAQDHGGPIALNPTRPKAELRPAEGWFRVLVEGESDTPLAAVREVKVHFEGTRESIAHNWSASAISVLIQQAGF
ncbi:MAG: HlyD family secretion protein [Variovorax sp.]|nr:MAG: HlyD family secretion protein [Variovorax sp.]